MDVDRVGGGCEQCGRPLPVSRHGGQRKRFCDATCRSRWHRGRPKAVTCLPISTAAGSVTRAEMIEKLERVYAELWADIEARGSIVGGRTNPSVPELRRVTEMLTKMAPPPDPEEQELADVLALARAHEGDPA